MPKRPDSLETLQLSHELLRRIPKGRTITAAELHQPGHYLNSVLGAERVPPFAEREDR